MGQVDSTNDTRVTEVEQQPTIDSLWLSQVGAIQGDSLRMKPC